MLERNGRKMIRCWLCVFGCLLLTSCAAVTGEKSARVPQYKGAPVVYIYPLSQLPSQSSVGILPFQVPANMSHGQALAVASLFKDVFLGRRAFTTVRQLEQPYADLGEAAQHGKKAGVDMVLAGKIHYALEGSAFGGARLDVSVRLLNVESGTTLWYVEQTMDQPMDYPDHGLAARLAVIFSQPPVRQSEGAPVMANMLARIASDMTEVMAGARTVAR